MEMLKVQTMVLGSGEAGGAYGGGHRGRISVVMGAILGYVTGELRRTMDGDHKSACCCVLG